MAFAAVVCSDVVDSSTVRPLIPQSGASAPGSAEALPFFRQAQRGQGFGCISESAVAKISRHDCAQHNHHLHAPHHAACPLPSAAFLLFKEPKRTATGAACPTSSRLRLDPLG